ncbi:MAG: RNA pseudouridine synthase [Saprospiraceae bacterium]|nr:MAG: RNA pseudouridine synthase [Saprospiraceae bacterium]
MKTPFTVLYEDETFIVINKPAGLLSIPDRYVPEKANLYHLLLATNEDIRIVHRLDRETSGIICFAKTEDAHKHLCKQFEERNIQKYYLALVDGHPNPEEGSIDRPIAKHPSKSGKMMVSNRGKEALTTYKILDKFQHFSLVDISIHTGRTHQIRVHFQGIGHSLAVDPLYGKREAFFLSEIKRKAFRIGKDQEERPLLSRTSLHASRLILSHPESEESIEFEAPLPKDLQAVIKQLNKWGK